MDGQREPGEALAGQSQPPADPAPLVLGQGQLLVACVARAARAGLDAFLPAEKSGVSVPPLSDLRCPPAEQQVSIGETAQGRGFRHWTVESALDCSSVR